MPPSVSWNICWAPPGAQAAASTRFESPSTTARHLPGCESISITPAPLAGSWKRVFGLPHGARANPSLRDGWGPPMHTSAALSKRRMVSLPKCLDGGAPACQMSFSQQHFQPSVPSFSSQPQAFFWQPTHCMNILQSSGNLFTLNSVTSSDSRAGAGRGGRRWLQLVRAASVASAPTAMPHSALTARALRRGGPHSRTSMTAS
mmetsp:Transcript_135712/g.378072  ORF Transcript_135712/g.378072 Transcript_135712/m.378072 type:complete len:203 (-) Transcript_135712:121-729(-)